jgi:hypothetical protein
MKKVINITVIRDQRGKTCQLVLAECRNLVSALNTPPPFETEPMKPDMESVAVTVKGICDKATSSVRVGYLSSSSFRVDRDCDSVNVFVLNHTNRDTLFFRVYKLPSYE